MFACVRVVRHLQLCPCLSRFTDLAAKPLFCKGCNICASICSICQDIDPKWVRT
jgi:Pyruvate/2-oxoacid:ferredoxin oxidoreductase delta subunit